MRITLFNGLSSGADQLPNERWRPLKSCYLICRPTRGGDVKQQTIVAVNESRLLATADITRTNDNNTMGHCFPNDDRPRLPGRRHDHQVNLFVHSLGQVLRGHMTQELNLRCK